MKDRRETALRLDDDDKSPEDSILASGTRTPTKRGASGARKPYSWNKSPPKAIASFRLLPQGHLNSPTFGALGKTDSLDARRHHSRTRRVTIFFSCLSAFAIILTFLWLARRGNHTKAGLENGNEAAAVSAARADILGLSDGLSFLRQADGADFSWRRLVGEQGQAKDKDSFNFEFWKDRALTMAARDVSSVQDLPHDSRQSEWEAAHVQFRNSTQLSLKVRLKPLKWDKRIEAYAWAHIKRVQTEDNCNLKGSTQEAGAYGENLYWSAYETGPSQDPYTPTSVVAEWFSTGQSYDYDANTCTAVGSCSPYCQIIWKQTRKFGCAMAECPYDGAFEGMQQIFACFYNPPMEAGACGQDTTKRRPY